MRRILLIIPLLIWGILISTRILLLLVRIRWILPWVLCCLLYIWSHVLLCDIRLILRRIWLLGWVSSLRIGLWWILSWWILPWGILPWRILSWHHLRWIPNRLLNNNSLRLLRLLRLRLLTVLLVGSVALISKPLHFYSNLTSISPFISQIIPLGNLSLLLNSCQRNTSASD